MGSFDAKEEVIANQESVMLRATKVVCPHCHKPIFLAAEEVPPANNPHVAERAKAIGANVVSPGVGDPSVKTVRGQDLYIALNECQKIR